MALKLRQSMVAALAFVTTLVGFYVVVVAWSLASIRCPSPPQVLAYVPPVLVVVAGLLVSVFLIRCRPRPVLHAAAWGMLVGWILWAVLAVSMRELPVACGLHEAYNSPDLTPESGSPSPDPSSPPSADSAGSVVHTPHARVRSEARR
jgi:hypothetical protein